MFELQTFPARDGDCLMLTWGEVGALHRLLIDGGREGTWSSLKAALLALPEDQREFELLVVTHIDADHIAGVLKMLADPDRPVRFREIWFNAYHHLRAFVPHETFGAAQGDKLSELLQDAHHLWNRSFEHGAVAVRDPAAPPRIDIAGLQVTLLSPTPEKLAKLEKEWRDWIETEKLRPGESIAQDSPQPPEEFPGFETFGSTLDVASLAAETLPKDNEPPNGSSIAFIARYGSHSVLLTGDAHADVFEKALSNLPASERAFDLVKLSHHGSRANLSPGLASSWNCANFLISTDGSRHGHPDAQTIAHLIVARPGSKTFFFNHRHKQAAAWDDARLKADHSYEATYPTTPGHLTIDLTALSTNF